MYDLKLGLKAVLCKISYQLLALGNTLYLSNLEKA